MRNKFVYSCSISLCLGIQWTLGKQFLPPVGHGSIFPAKSYWDAWRSGSQLVRGQVNMADEAKFRGLIFEALVWDTQSCIVVEKKWAFSVDQCQLQVLQFLVHLFDLLSLLLRCNGFTRTQKAVVDQTGSRPPNSDHDFFFWVQLWLWEVLRSFF